MVKCASVLGFSRNMTLLTETTMNPLLQHQRSVRVAKVKEAMRQFSSDGVSPATAR
jgi:hypothetical protein